jgi:alanyl-tRNA synthetase
MIKGVTLNGLPLETHDPDIKEIVKESTISKSVRRVPVRFRPRAETRGKVKVYTLEEIQNIMNEKKPILTESQILKYKALAARISKLEVRVEKLRAKALKLILK